MVEAVPPEVLSNVAPILRRVDRPLFVAWAAACTLASARAFYGYMLKQTGGEWSAPLDDVFIHFDYARATARGHPFEWVDGNGYSSGNTSLLYPFVLALGYWSAFAIATHGVGGDRRRGVRLRDAARARDGSSSAATEATTAGRCACRISSRRSSSASARSTGRSGAGWRSRFFLGTWALALLAFLALDRRRTSRDEAYATSARVVARRVPARSS